MKISSPTTQCRWSVANRPFNSTAELLDQVQLNQGEEALAVCQLRRQNDSRRLHKARNWGALGAAAGLAAGAIGPWSALSSTLVGGGLGAALGALLGGAKQETVSVAGRLAAGQKGLTFTPNNESNRSIRLGQQDELSLLPRSAEAPASLDELRQRPELGWKIPSRAEIIQQLKDSVSKPLDILVIGGGATGTGTALDAARRGLRVGALEAFDFSSGTSSKSTKLIHGGVRYLEKAVKKLDKEQYALVKEGLEERGTFLRMAPHLTNEVRLATPCYKWREIPYYYAGLWMYDRIAGQAALSATQVLGKQSAIEALPEIKREGLKGAVTYSDGEFNDSRMNVSLATTAAAHGAAIANYVEVVSLLKEGGKVVGVQARDKRSGESFPIRARSVVNAAGPFIDGIRKMDHPQAPDLVVPSAGTHILVAKLHLKEGVLIPHAPNGSVAFLKPFEGGTLIGTTEEKTELTINPQTTQKQVDYLRHLANTYLNPENQIQPSDITSVWTGIRPLVKDPKAPQSQTAELVRNHVVDVSPSGLVTIGGGKWTSFGRMAQDTVDAALQTAGLPAVPAQREGSQVIGAHGYSPQLAGWLSESYGLEQAVAQHLARNYGDRAVQVAELAQNEKGRLHPDHPYLAAEVLYACRQEMAQTPVDILSRRTRLSFVDEKATLEALPRVVELMARELQWNPQQQQAELESARSFYLHNGKNGLS
ncbi:MAG: FAD-dependent oxidoreductase [Vulcanimicrobiota bacterium]